MWPTRIFLVASATNDRVIAGRIWIALPIEPSHSIWSGKAIRSKPRPQPPALDRGTARAQSLPDKFRTPSTCLSLSFDYFVVQVDFSLFFHSPPHGAQPLQVTRYGVSPWLKSADALTLSQVGALDLSSRARFVFLQALSADRSRLCPPIPKLEVR